MARPRAFISHIADESGTAQVLKSALRKDFLGLLDVFVSSDEESIAAGDAWLESIDRALRSADVMLVLCSPASVRRAWVNFEAGAAWMRKIPIIPLCHAGLRPADLPMPLSSRHGLSLALERDLKKLYARVAREIECDVPEGSLAPLVERLGISSEQIELSSADMSELDQDRAIKQRLLRALEHPRYKWRSLNRVAIEAGISEEVAADHLRAALSVKFSKGKSGKVIVGLRSRI